MLKKYILLFLLPLSMTSFGQSLPLHAEQDASENSQQTLEKETQKAVNEEPQQVLKENSQQALSKEMIIKNVDLEKATLRSRFFAGSLTLLLEGLLILGIIGILAFMGGVYEIIEDISIKSWVREAFFVSAVMSVTHLLFSLVAGFMSYNAPLELKIVGKNGEDTTFLQRFWYAFSVLLLPFVWHIVEAIYLYMYPKAEIFKKPIFAVIVTILPFILILIAQGALLAIKKKTLSEYVTGLQVVKKKPSAPVKK